MAWDPHKEGPPYPDLGPSVAKFRRKDHLSLAEKQAYSDAIRRAILAKQRSELQRELPSIAPNCASRTWHTDGDKIHDAVRRQQVNALQAHVARIRRDRQPWEWKQLYEAAMAEKRARKRRTRRAG